MKRSSELVKELKNKKEQLQKDIYFLEIFKQHIEKNNNKVINKNVLNLENGKVRGYIRKDYAVVFNAYMVDDEGFYDYKALRLDDERFYGLELSTPTEEGKKERLNAAAINAAIDERITRKREEIKTIENSTEAEIIRVYKEYNNLMIKVKELYNANSYILDAAGVDSEIRLPHTAEIDAEGFHPIRVDQRLSEEVQKQIEQIKENYNNYKVVNDETMKIIKNDNSFISEQALELYNIYGGFVVGDKDYSTLYLKCEDKFGVVPCVNVSINKGYIC